MDAASHQHATEHATESPEQQRFEPAFRVIDILKDHAAAFVRGHPGQAVRQVQSTLTKIALCRTPALGASWHWCAECDTGIRIPNSCGDRHCPQCRGATRAAWVNSTMKKIVSGVDYYQVVFTMPDALSSLALGNRRVIFNLLFHAAWKALKKVLEAEQAYEAAAAMVLHTWNQHLDSHVHLHAVVPGGGPSLTHSTLGGFDVDCHHDSPRHRPPGRPGWKNAVPPPHERPDRWWLVDADKLRQEFRDTFLKGLRRLYANGELKLTGDWSYLQDKAAFEEFLYPMEQQSWVTYIQPPPHEASEPEDIVKYLARYLTGGPISDARIVNYKGGQVTFLARTGCVERSAKVARRNDVPCADDPHATGRRDSRHQTEKVKLSAVEFVRRWCLHILPKGFTKTRSFGGWSNHHSKRYIEQCRELRQQAEPAVVEPTVLNETTDQDDDIPSGPPCPVCGGELERRERVHRTSWRDIIHGDDCPPWYAIRESPG